MIKNDKELAVTRRRVEQFQQWLAQMRQTAAPANFESMASGYRLEIEKMQAEMMDYLLRPIEPADEKQPV
jgi:hypothetical protein